MPSQPFPPVSNPVRPHTHHKTPSTSRRPPSRPVSAIGNAKVNSTPRSIPVLTTTATATTASRTANSKSVEKKENEPRNNTREKPPSKDGTVQKIAKDVEGLKDFQLGDCIGRGAFGSVYRALNWSTGETVAVKRIRLQDLPKAELNGMMQEINLLKNLNHPNIVKYQGYVKSTDSLYIILEYCENGSLHSICKNFGKFPENLVSMYTAQVLQGLLFLHDQGVIHRDIKGANILTTKEGLVKLADFGVATKQTGLSEGSVVGTPYWMAPEVIELSGASTASDIWSLGCTVIELLDGKPPYHKFAPMPALFRIVNDDHPPLPEGISPLVRDFLMQCFQKDPNMRVTAKKLLKHPWIMSANKARRKHVPKQDEAIKYVQEWNEVLRTSPKESSSTPRPSERSIPRPVTRGSVTRRPDTGQKSSAESRGLGIINPRSPQTVPRRTVFDDEDGNENWDSDFEALTDTMSVLRIPDRLKPQDNFAGQLSADKLKQYASYDPSAETEGKLEAWDEEFEGELTVRSSLPLQKTVDTARIVKKSYSARDMDEEIRLTRALNAPTRKGSSDLHDRKVSRDSQPRTQILRPSPKSTAPLRPSKAAPVSRKHGALAAVSGKEKYQEDEEEDYSDLVPTDEAAFNAKLAGFSPSRAYGPDDLRHVTNGVSGSVIRRQHTPTNLVHDAAAMRRKRSSLEIQKYAEHAEDEDFTDLCFEEEDGAPIDLRPAKTRSSPKSASTGSEPSVSDRGTTRLSRVSSWMVAEEDEDDEEDPFAAMEEELDDVDLESNAARDKHARLCTLVEGLVSDLKLSQPEEALADIVEQLLHILSESPDVKNVIVSSHGMLPILEILDTDIRPLTLLRLLRTVNIIISNNVEVQENLCFVGGIPIISRFAHKKYSSDIRLEAAAFVRMVYQTSTLTLQMFVSCGGLNVLVEFLEEDYDSDVGRELVLTGVNGVWSVFELQGPTPKNDFCRIFSRSSVLYPLSLVLNRVLDEDRELGEVIEGRIVNIFYLFSQAENHVKETVADRMVLKRVLKDLKRMSPQHQVTMLKFIKNLSMLATTLDALQNSNAIEVLTDLLGASMNALHFREISNQVLNTMFNLCRLSKARQEDAALSGIVPILQRIVQTERPLKEFALPILCDMAHSGKVGRKLLWQNRGLQFYVGLLTDQYWTVTALDAIFIWLQEETAKVEEHLLNSPAFSDAIVQCFNDSKADTFENMLEPLQKMLRLSPLVAASLAQQSLFERAAVKVHAKKPLVRLNLLRVIRCICEASEAQGTLLTQYGLLEAVQSLAKHDNAILVREMANELLKTSDFVPGTPNTNRVGGIRRSSSSNVTSPVHMPPTPVTDRVSVRGGYFDFGMDLNSRTRGPAVSPMRPASRDASSTSASTAQWSNIAPGSSSGKSDGRVPMRNSMAALGRTGSRLSLAPLNGSKSSLRIQQDVTPTHTPPSANTRSNATAALAGGRRRRQTSSGTELKH